MMEHQQQYVLIHSDPQDFKEFLADVSGVPAENITPEQEEKLRSILSRLEDHPFNKADGEVRTLIGKVHFPLRKTIYNGFVSALKLSASAAGVVFHPAVGGIALTATVLDIAQKVQETFSLLNEDQLEVYEAILAVQVKNQTPSQAYVAEKEIREVFVKRGEEGPDLESVLEQLAQKQVIEKKWNGKNTCYRVVP